MSFTIVHCFFLLPMSHPSWEWKLLALPVAKSPKSILLSSQFDSLQQIPFSAQFHSLHCCTVAALKHGTFASHIDLNNEVVPESRNVSSFERYFFLSLHLLSWSTVEPLKEVHWLIGDWHLKALSWPLLFLPKPYLSLKASPWVLHLESPTCSDPNYRLISLEVWYIASNTSQSKLSHICPCPIS